MRLVFLLGCYWVGLLYIHAQIIPFNEEWKYNDIGAEPSIQSGTSWYEPSYDDSGWVSGNGQLGYGDGDEDHLVSSSATTVYFRKAVNVVDPDIYDHIILNLLYDDGVVVYINGIEKWRVNMPSGTINYDVFASSNSGDNATSTISLTNELVSGNNTIAVEVHQ